MVTHAPRHSTVPRPPVPISQPPVTPQASARRAGLRYVSDDTPGIRRVAAGKRFRYVDAAGKSVRDALTLARIRSLVIPPAWTDVWICPVENGHIQATGRDARGRKQYRYHPRWQEVRDETKYGKLVLFGHALPRIRKRLQKDLSLPGLPRDKVLATVVRLLETTLIRVGNEEYVRANGSYGLTTFRDEHARINGSTLTFSFHGKSGVRHSVDIRDPRLARIVKRSQELPGEELFQYVDENGDQHTIESADVNEYLRRIAGADFTAKDLRTWAGTVLAARALQEFEAFDSKTQAKRNIVKAIEEVAKRLGNTKAVCKKCYVHPAVLDGYLDGHLLETLRRRVETEIRDSLHKLPPEEAAVLAFLQEELKNEKKRVQREPKLIEQLRRSVRAVKAKVSSED
ncbi:MAG: DNA topoisomerase IB [Gemmataceae bacterium]